MPNVELGDIVEYFDKVKNFFTSLSEKTSQTNAMAGRNYEDFANLRMEFIKVAASATGDKNSKTTGSRSTSSPPDNWQDPDGGKSGKLYGFVSDDGLSLTLTNKFLNTLELAGSIFGQVGELVSSVKTVFADANVQGYISTGIGGKSIILNSPFYWQGTNPIDFNLTFYQIADTEDQILTNYRNVLVALSPTVSSKSEIGGNEHVVATGTGPALINVHYFPKKPSATNLNRDTPGRIVFQNCLCSSVKMDIKAPYSGTFSPIVGIYTFQLQVSRILDSNSIDNIFKWTTPIITAAAAASPETTQKGSTLARPRGGAGAGGAGA